MTICRMVIWVQSGTEGTPRQVVIEGVTDASEAKGIMTFSRGEQALGTFPRDDILSIDRFEYSARELEAFDPAKPEVQLGAGGTKWP
jgi:hypothetical protein